MLTCRREQRGAVAVVRVAGNLDALSISDFKVELNALSAAGCRSCVIDLSGVTIVDSSGVGGIISFFKRIRSLGGDVRISGLSGQPKEIFRLLGLERAFDILPTVDEALAKFSV